MRRLAPLVLLLAGVACGGDSPRSEPVGLEPTVAPTTTAPRPSVKPTARPTATTPPPTPTTPPPPTGATVGTGGAVLAVVQPGAPRKVAGGTDCSAVFPDISGPKCYALTLDGGSALWVTGRVDGVAVVRVLTLDEAAGGYVDRYAGREGGARWNAVNAFVAPLAGHGNDGLVVTVRLLSGALTYDVLTWVKGGPLVLRAHRPPLSDGRLAAKDGRLDEYALVPDGRYARRTLAWDGRYFRLSAPTGVPPEAAPPR